jgi:hypothetical protein
MVSRLFPARKNKHEWCGRRESNPHEPVRLYGFSYRLRLSPPKRSAECAIAKFAVWTIPSPSPGRSGAEVLPV